jgi:hypothetical protein
MHVVDASAELLLVGISLSLDQWKPLARRLRDISAAVEIVEEDRVGDKSTVVNMTDCLIGAEAGDERSIAFSVSTVLKELVMTWGHSRNRCCRCSCRPSAA